MGDKRRRYTKEFKLDAIRLLESGTKPGHQIERELGIGSGRLYRWKKELSQDGERSFPGNGKSRDEELEALRKENKELREERDILRKATAIFSRLQTPGVEPTACRPQHRRGTERESRAGERAPRADTADSGRGESALWEPADDGGAATAWTEDRTQPSSPHHEGKRAWAATKEALCADHEV